MTMLEKFKTQNEADSYFSHLDGFPANRGELFHLDTRWPVNTGGL